MVIIAEIIPKLWRKCVFSRNGDKVRRKKGGGYQAQGLVSVRLFCFELFFKTFECIFSLELLPKRILAFKT